MTKMALFVPSHSVVKAVCGFCLIIGLGFGVSGCASAPKAPVIEEPRFVKQKAIPVRALKVVIDSQYHPTFMPPNVEHLIPIPPERVARQWALDRLQPLRSGQVIAKFTIEDAHVTETTLAKTATGVKGFLTDEPSERYDAYLKVRLSYTDPVSGKNGEVETSVKYSMTVQEGASLNEREAVWAQLVAKLGKAFDTAMVANIHQYLPEFIAN